MPEDAPDTDVGDRIQQYLHEHPQAADTREGIRQWWLQREGGEKSAADVQAALDRLVEQKVIARIDRPGMPAVYRSTHRRDGGSRTT